MTSEITEIPVGKIVADTHQDRTVFDQTKLEELAESIRQHGLAQPITVRPFGWDAAGNCMECGESGRCRCPHFLIVAGERRYRAISHVLKLATVPCIVRNDLNDESASAIQLIENAARQDLTPMDEARAYQKRIDRFGWSTEKIGQAAGVSERLVKRRLLLLTLVPEVQLLVQSGNLDLPRAESLAVLDHNRQRICMRVYAMSPAMTRVAFQAMVNNLLAQQSQDQLFSTEALWVQRVVEDQMYAYGAKATVIVPEADDLPAVDTKKTKGEKPGDILYAYMLKLKRAGFYREACAVGAVYKALVIHQAIVIPDHVLAMTADAQRELLG